MFKVQNTMSTSNYLSFLLLLIIINTSLSPLVHSFASSHQQIHETKTKFGFSTNLIHRDNPQSPFYNPNLTKSERIKAGIQRSQSRSRFLRSSHKITPNEPQTQLTPDHGLYVMNFSIGTPPVQTFAIADTASELIWLQCLPCAECYKQKLPIFDPAQSWSYNVLNCDDPICSLTTDAKCNQTDHHCIYNAEYGDGSSYSHGDLSLDTLTFGDHGPSGEIPLANMVIGCGHKNSQTPPDIINPPGIVGLNQKNLSFIKQLQIDQFSYCLVEDKFNRSSRMRFDSEAVLFGGKTPLLEDGKGMDDAYYLFLDGISVGSTRLPTSAGFFNMSSDGTEGGFMIDSGMDYTSFKPEANDMLIEEMKKQIKNLNPGVDPLGGFAPCYNTTFDVIKHAAPALTLHFGGLDLTLNKESTWLDVGQGNVCLATLPSMSSMTIFGSFQQQNMNVAFDLKKKVVSFMNMEDCMF